MARIKLSAFDTAPDVNSFDYFVGVRDNDDGTFSNYKYTAAQIAAQSRLVYIIEDDGTDHITDAWIEGKDIQVAFAGGAAYLEGENFTVDGDTVTFLDRVVFSVGQKVILMV